MRTWHHIALLLIVSLFIYFFGLGSMALTDPDETFYAQTAREMFEADEWTTPLLFGQPQFEKPIFYYWSILVSYQIFGVNEFSARLPSVIFAIFGLFGVYFLARLIFSPLCGFFSTIICATCVEYLVLARACVTDMALAVFILYCFLFFLLGWTAKKKIFYLLASAAAALAVLTKGPIGFFIPAAVIAGYIALSGNIKRIREIPLMLSALVFFAISLPWYLAAYNLHGEVFLNEFFGFQNITRFLIPEHKAGSSPLFYIPVVLGGFFPWTIFLLFGAWAFYKVDHFTSRVSSHKLFLTLWFFAIFLFFSVSRTKLVTYIFPLFPVLAIITGRFWERSLLDSYSDKKVHHAMDTSYFLFILCNIAALTGVYLVVKYKYGASVVAVVIPGLTYLAGMFVSLLFYMLKRKLAAFLCIVLTVMVLMVPVVIKVFPEIEIQESSKKLGLMVKDFAKKGDIVGGEQEQRRGLAYYSGRTDVKEFHPGHKLFAFLSRPRKVWAVVKKEHYQTIVREKPQIYMNKIAESGEYVLVTNKP